MPESNSNGNASHWRATQYIDSSYGESELVTTPGNGTKWANLLYDNI